MKSLKILALAGFAILQTNSFAQQTECNSAAKENFGSDEAGCKRNISLYTEYLKQGQMADAVKYWREAKKICPEFKPSLYLNGQIIYKSLIDAEKDAATKELYIDTLLSLYEQQIKIFGPCPEYYENWGNAALKYRQSKPEIANDAFAKNIEIKKETSSGVSIYGYYLTNYLLYKAKKIDCNKMVEDYMKLSDYLDQSCKETPDDGTCKLARETLDKYAAGCLSCDKLIEIYTKKFDALPADKDAAIKELSKMSDMLAKKECKGDLVDKIAEKLYELEPSHKAAFALAQSNNSKGKNSEALKWVKQAIEQCPDCEENLKYQLFAAQLSQSMGSCGTAMSYAKTVIAKDNTGTYKCDAYLVVARCIAASASTCGDNDFKHKWTYCLALDYLDKAKAAGCTNTAGLYSSYTANCPTKNDLFTYGKNVGDPVTVECFGESTKLRASN